ncbi:MAG: DUF4242 domain-containing protein [Actinomycetota bacterium]|nr:DUF4242 domain-containing protein [Actinomycetota bacterium]
MTTFIVESYLPGVSDVDLRRVAPALPGRREVRYLRSIFMPHDETCFHLFEGPSVEAVRQVAELAAIRFERIVEAVQLNPAA